MKNVTLAVSFALILAGPVVTLAAGPTAVNLGTAGNYAILAKTGVSTTGTTAITGNVGLSPAAATYITGFALILPAASAFSTSALVTGNVYAPGYADPTPANLTTAILDMQTAYTDAAGRAANVTELGAGNIGGLTLAPDVYKWGTGVTITTDVTLSGNANDVWIFQIAQNLNVSSGVHIILSGGAQASNIFWQVAGQTTIGTTAVFNGNILGQTAIVLNTGAVLNGRSLAQTAVTLDANSVTAPTSNSAVHETPATPATTVRASLGGTTTGSATSAAVHVFKANLTIGSLGSEVKALQEFLNAHGHTVAMSGAGSPGNETTWFGTATKTALIKYQKAKGIAPASGYFGVLTRATVNK